MVYLEALGTVFAEIKTRPCLASQLTSGVCEWKMRYSAGGSIYRN